MVLNPGMETARAGGAFKETFDSRMHDKCAGRNPLTLTLTLTLTMILMLSRVFLALGEASTEYLSGKCNLSVQ